LIAIDAFAFAYQSTGSLLVLLGFTDFLTLFAMCSLIVFAIELNAGID